MDQDSRLDRAEEFRDAQHYAEAMALCDEVIATLPDNSRAYYVRAGIHRLLREATDAIIDIHEAIELDPTEPAYHYFLSHWQLEQGQLVEAVNAATECIRLGAEHGADYYRSAAYFIRAISRLRLGRFSLAANDCECVEPNTAAHIGRLYTVEEVAKWAKDGTRGDG